MQPAASNALRTDKSKCPSTVFIFKYCIVLYKKKFTQFHHKQDSLIFHNFNTWFSVLHHQLHFRTVKEHFLAFTAVTMQPT